MLSVLSCILVWHFVRMHQKSACETTIRTEHSLVKNQFLVPKSVCACNIHVIILLLLLSETAL